MAKKKEEAQTLPPPTGLTDALAQAMEPKSELDKVVSMLLDPANIRHNTDLSAKQITAVSGLQMLQRKYRLEMLEGFLEEYLPLMVSKGRKGRGEWVKMLSKHVDQQFQPGGEQRQSWWRRRV